MAMRLAGFLLAFAALPLLASDIVFENDVARLILGSNGVARSLKLKATGEELLAQPAVTPIARIEHARPYDKIAQLTHPAQMRTFPANRIERKMCRSRTGTTSRRRRSACGTDKARRWNAPLALWTDLRQLEENPETGRILAVFRELNGR